MAKKVAKVSSKRKPIARPAAKAPPKAKKVATRATVGPEKTPAPIASESIVTAVAAPSGQFRVIHLVSDSTGNLAKHMLTAFLTQFPSNSFDVRVKNFVRSEDDVRRVMASVAAQPGMVLHALVSDQGKGLINQECNRLGVPACDLTGNFVQFLAGNSGIEPAQDPAKLHRVNASYHRRIEAVEFAISHDDGLGAETLHEADVVLCGVSRTSKTPTTMYLAQQGYLVGNVALAMEVDPPKHLLDLPREKVAALIIDPSVLTDIRTRRQGTWHMGDTSYNDSSHVEEEIEWSRKLFRRMGWRVIDVTNQAIEETAARIVDVMQLRRPGLG